MTSLNIFLENFIFLLLSTSFFVFVGWMWRDLKPMSLPEPLPGWFKIWFGTVQVLSGLLPLVVMLLCGVVWGSDTYVTLRDRTFSVFLSYYLMLGLQILFESLTLRQYKSVVWVMVPYLYLPYRIWQLYEGLIFLGSESELMWVRYFLILQIVVWTVNYALDVSQLPRLFRWAVQDNSEAVGVR
ncbi:hypothetical protein OGM63_12915 [Plectonema radiosum NIES-515]|uniref:Uncharacterized protein n=1 Tax=Plectonema radiosum NIES-515 TaxID=2986073 RepID=A0ABT3AZ44_9CYAN|nr:hypothetical protein [Plectonema radiosum]MCV3214402.1 hypothetical protein [Plectonema radiosum NIES-515]